MSTTIAFYRKATDKGLFKNTATKDLYDEVGQEGSPMEEATALAYAARCKAYNSDDTKANNRERAIEALAVTLEKYADQAIEEQTADGSFARIFAFRALAEVDFEEVAAELIDGLAS